MSAEPVKGQGKRAESTRCQREPTVKGKGSVPKAQDLKGKGAREPVNGKGECEEITKIQRYEKRGDASQNSAAVHIITVILVTNYCVEKKKS